MKHPLTQDTRKLLERAREQVAMGNPQTAEHLLDTVLDEPKSELEKLTLIDRVRAVERLCALQREAQAHGFVCVINRVDLKVSVAIPWTKHHGNKRTETGHTIEHARNLQELRAVLGY